MWKDLKLSYKQESMESQPVVGLPVHVSSDAGHSRLSRK